MSAAERGPRAGGPAATARRILAARGGRAGVPGAGGVVDLVVADPTVPRPPAIEVDLAGAVPGPVVRLLPGAAALAAGLALGPVPGAVGFAVLVVAVLVVVRPTWPAPAALLLLAGATVWADGDHLVPEPGGGVLRGGVVRIAALVLTLHLVTRLTALGAHVAWTGVVEVPVLARVVRSVLGLQLVVQALLLGAVWVRTGLAASVAGSAVLTDGLRVVGVLAGLGALALVLPRAWLVRRAPRAGGDRG